MAILKFTESIPEIVHKGLERRVIYTSNLMTVIVDFTDGPCRKLNLFIRIRTSKPVILLKAKLFSIAKVNPNNT